MIYKLLDLVGFALVGGTIFAFLGLVARQDPLGWPVFWACAAGAVASNVYKRHLKKKGSRES